MFNSATNGTTTKNSAPFFTSSSIEVVTELEDEVFCTRKINLAPVINHGENANNGHYMCLVQDEIHGGIAMIKLWCQ